MNCGANLPWELFQPYLFTKEVQLEDLVLSLNYKCDWKVAPPEAPHPQQAQHLIMQGIMGKQHSFWLLKILCHKGIKK